MNLYQALAAAARGGRVTCDALPTGTVVKLQPVGEWPADKMRVVFEATGAGFNFFARDDHKRAIWRKVEGWI